MTLWDPVGLDSVVADTTSAVLPNAAPPKHSNASLRGQPGADSPSRLAVAVMPTTAAAANGAAIALIAQFSGTPRLTKERTGTPITLPNALVVMLCSPVIILLYLFAAQFASTTNKLGLVAAKKIFCGDEPCRFM